MGIDGDTHPHYDSHQLVNLTTLQLSIHHTGNLFCSLFTTLSHLNTHPHQKITPTMTSDPMDDDDDVYFQHHANLPPVDLSTIQQEFQQNMLSL